MPKIGESRRGVEIRPAPTELTPYWATRDGRTVRYYLGHVIDVLKRLRRKSVHMCVTSPPYWGLRDYGTAEWEGGDPACDHKRPNNGSTAQVIVEGYTRPFRHGKAFSDHAEEPAGTTCRKCGAVRVRDQQLGSEPSPDCGTQGQAQCGGCFVCSMVAVFRGVRRVMRDDATLWLNLGDSYSTSPKGNPGAGDLRGRGKETDGMGTNYGKKVKGLVNGNLVGIPWRVALALQADGWVLRQDIIWAKPSPMPESVRNRCTKAHEYVFLLTKRGSGYFYDQEAIKSDSLEPGRAVKVGDKSLSRYSGGDTGNAAEGVTSVINPNLSNKRSVWSVDDNLAMFEFLRDRAPDLLAEFLQSLYDKDKLDVWRVSSQGYPGAHFATYPPRLIEPMILAGTSAKGCCPNCGAPWRRVVEEEKLTRERPNEYVKRVPPGLAGPKGSGRIDAGIHQGGVESSTLGMNTCSNSVAGVAARTVGWEPTCGCGIEDVKPAVVLDPFIGSGTTSQVAFDHGRDSIGIDLSETYLKEHAIPRVTGAIMARPDRAWLVRAEPVRISFGIAPPVILGGV